MGNEGDWETILWKRLTKRLASGEGGQGVTNNRYSGANSIIVQNWLNQSKFPLSNV